MNASTNGRAPGSPATVDLFWMGAAGSAPSWPLGRVLTVEPTVCALHDCVQDYVGGSNADACLIWDGALGSPDPKRILDALDLPGDLWHAGLRLGQGGLPGLLDYVQATWMLNCDPDPTIEATSWRISLRCCLLRTEVLRRMGGPWPAFATLEAAALEMGHRYLAGGVLARHIPWLVSEPATFTPAVLPLEEQVRFLHFRFARTWVRWALLRACLRGEVSPAQATAAWQKVRPDLRPRQPAPFRPANHAPEATQPKVLRDDLLSASVTVLIPTVDRYPYLRTLLDQLRRQSVPPTEILVLDQTAETHRDLELMADFSDLPLHVSYLQEPGQCTSRNLGLLRARGDYVLFLDDDDEVPNDLIESHLRSLWSFRADVSSGVSNEVGVGPRSADYTLYRAADGFPTNNTLVRRGVLLRSGLFDLAYDRGQRADGDLGMRIYLNGALMVLNPDISVLHHHAPQGGLRTHKARVITYAKSRSSLVYRHLPSATELYLTTRYFTSRQVNEAIWLRVLGTFSMRGSKLKRVAKLTIGVFCLPDTLRRIRRTQARAHEMLREFPQIPELACRDQA